VIVDRPRTRGEDLADFGIPFTLKYPVSTPIRWRAELLPPFARPMSGLRLCWNHLMANILRRNTRGTRALCSLALP
jgi:hypothetical protein